MEFRYFSPSGILKPYIKCYYIFESDSDAGFTDTVFPSGEMEVIFNLGEGIWESFADKGFYPTPAIELWGQLTKPLAIRSRGRHTMLGIRFLTHSAARFINEDIGEFNNRVADLGSILGKPVEVLYLQLLETAGPEPKIALVERFLLDRLARSEKNAVRITKIGDILSSLQKSSSEQTISTIASRHGITPRYLQKILYRHTGLSPKSFNKIKRFQLSLRLIAKNKDSFTSIAYDCGYFDQSHFIRDFKSFTGVTPSAYLENKFPVNQAFLS